MALALVGDMHGGGPKQPSALKEAQPQAIQLRNVRGNVRTWQREKGAEAARSHQAPQSGVTR